MAQMLKTPLTQALEEGKLTREELKGFMARSDRAGVVHLAKFLTVFAVTSTLLALAWDHCLMWPAMFLHGIVLVHFFSLEHECVHWTVFRTRWLNNAAGYACGFVIMLPFKHFRYEHCDHHTHTQLEGEDPEQVPMPRTFGQYLLYLSALPYWRNKFTELLRHVAGRLSPAEEVFVPKEERGAIILEAQIMAALYAVIVAGMIATGSDMLVWTWFVPLLLGEPVMRWIRMTEHVGRPTVARMSENTRTNLVSAPWRLLCWNMNYHAEHHYVASVPFHALPRLHEKLKDHVHVEPGGYLGAHREILRQLITPKAAAETPAHGG